MRILEVSVCVEICRTMFCCQIPIYGGIIMMTASKENRLLARDFSRREKEELYEHCRQCKYGSAKGGVS